MIGFRKYLTEGDRDPQLPHASDGKYLYHTAARSDLDSIKQHGLHAQSAGRNFGFKTGKVHLARGRDSAEYWNGMVNHKLSGSSYDSSKSVLLRVHRKNVETHELPGFGRGELATQRVHPIHIDHHDGHSWKPLVEI